VEISRPGRLERRESSDFVAAEDAGAYADSAGPLLEHAVGVEWYDRYGTEVDRAAMTLCLLRRAKAGERGAPQHGDEAVRRVLSESSQPALVWLASRAISYMDESGFPEAVEPWFRDE
jgi:hypothetical protein